MGVFRVEKTKNYTVMSNYHFKDKSISWKAKGMLSTFLSLPEDWDYSIAGLETMSTDGNKAVRSGLKELEANGYLTRIAIRDNKGIIRDWDYIIYENPLENPNWSKEFAEVLNPEVQNGQMDKPDVQKGQVEKVQVEKAHVEKDIQLNTNILNTKEINILNNKDKEITNNIYVEDLLPETQMIVNAGYIDITDNQIKDYNQLINIALSNYRIEDVRRVVKYILNNLGENIINKYAYFKESLETNLNKINIVYNIPENHWLTGASNAINNYHDKLYS